MTHPYDLERADEDIQEMADGEGRGGGRGRRTAGRGRRSTKSGASRQKNAGSRGRSPHKKK